MAKAVIARHYVIEYTIPGVDESTRSMLLTARFPERELSRFRRVNPKALVLRMYDKHSGVDVSLENENQKVETLDRPQVRMRTKDSLRVN